MRQLRSGIDPVQFVTDAENTTYTAGQYVPDYVAESLDPELLEPEN